MSRFTTYCHHVIVILTVASYVVTCKLAHAELASYIAMTGQSLL